MISRIRIEAFGASASEVEATLKTAYSVVADALEPGERVRHSVEAQPDGEMVIERDLIEPYGQPTAFKGRMLLHLNVACDGGQVSLLQKHGVDVSLHRWDTEGAFAVGGVPTA